VFACAVDSLCPGYFTHLPLVESTPTYQIPVVIVGVCEQRRKLKRIAYKRLRQVRPVRSISTEIDTEIKFTYRLNLLDLWVD